jgi:hypothetical protein
MEGFFFSFVVAKYQISMVFSLKPQYLLFYPWSASVEIRFGNTDGMSMRTETSIMGITVEVSRITESVVSMRKMELKWNPCVTEKESHSGKWISSIL